MVEVPRGRHVVDLGAVGAAGLLEHLRRRGRQEEGGGPLPPRLFNVEDLGAVLADSEPHHGAVLGRRTQPLVPGRRDDALIREIFALGVYSFRFHMIFKKV